MANVKTQTSATGPGRPREVNHRGAGYKLAEFLDDNWNDRVGLTNEEVAAKMGYKSSNIVSMWRTGRTKVALERLGEIAGLMKVDLAVLLPLWFEQQLGEAGDGRQKSEAKLKDIEKLFQRMTTVHEWALIRNIRKHFGTRDPSFSKEQADAVFLIATDPAFAEKVLELAKSEGVSAAA